MLDDTMIFFLFERHVVLRILIHIPHALAEYPIYKYKTLHNFKLLGKIFNILQTI